jgi:hypothetical protein
MTSGGLSPDIASLIVWIEEDQSLAVTVTVTFGLAVWNACACALNPARMASPASEKPTFSVMFPYLEQEGSCAAALVGAAVTGAAVTGAVVGAGVGAAVVAAPEQPTTNTATSAIALCFQ